MGLQFENLVIGNLSDLLPLLGLRGVLLSSAAPSNPAISCVFGNSILQKHASKKLFSCKNMHPL